MGFETQEDAERFVEAADAHRDAMREMHPQERAWIEVTQLPAYKEIRPETRTLIREAFNFGWAKGEKHGLNLAAEIIRRG